VVGEPAKPAYLSDLASAAWDDFAKDLRDEGRLYRADGNQMENAACEGLCLTQPSRARASIRKGDSGQATSPVAQLQARVNLHRVK